MSAHVARWDLNDSGPTVNVVTGTSGTIDDIEEWGSQVPFDTTAGAAAYTVPPPNRAGQRLDIILKVDGGDLVLTAPSGTTFNGTQAIATMADAKDVLILESFLFAGGLEWRQTFFIGVAFS